LTRATSWPDQNPEPGPWTGPATGPSLKTMLEITLWGISQPRSQGNYYYTRQPCLMKIGNIQFYSITFENGIPKLHGYISPFWKDILLVLDPNSVIGLVLRQNLKFMIGSSILFWSNVWIESNAFVAFSRGFTKFQLIRMIWFMR
jgi:hypothetical protein